MADEETLAAAAAAGHVEQLAQLVVLLNQQDQATREATYDALSFEIFDAAAAHAGEVAPTAARHAESLMLGLAADASAREVFCMVLEGFGKYRAPRAQLLLMRSLAVVLPRLRRRRAENLLSCLDTLAALFLEDWPGEAWDEQYGEDAEDGEDAAGGGQPPSSRLFDLLLECAAPLAADALPHAPPSAGAEPGAPVDATGRQLRQRLLHLLLRLLEVGSRGAEPGAGGRAAEAISGCAPRASELAPVAAATGAVAEPAAPGGPNPNEPAAPCAHPLGAALFLSHALPAPAQPAPAPGPEPAAAAEPADGAPSASMASDLVAELAAAEPAARLAALSPPAEVLLRCGGRGFAGRALLDWAAEAAPRCCLELPTSQAAVEPAARALLAHMASATEQSERSAAYRALQRLLWLWPTAPRLALLSRLIPSCPFPNVVALLLHRLKEEHLAERDSAHGAPLIFSTAALIELAGPMLEPPPLEAGPLDSLDALMGALNLVRFLLAAAAATASPAPPADTPQHTVSPSAARQLRADRLAPLDAALRRRMDLLWPELQAAEAREPPPQELNEMRVCFTHLHVAADVAARALEQCVALGERA